MKTKLKKWLDLRTATWQSPVDMEQEKRTYLFNSGNFYSYATAEKAALHVSNYQWSAPGEWFAELYAICWYKHGPPPSAVPAALLPYLPQKGGGAGAPG